MTDQEPFLIPPMEDPMFVTEKNRAKEWVYVSRKLSDNIKCQKIKYRKRISISYFRLSIDHQLGILSLADDEIFAPMCALLRPQYDAFCRGVWFLERATPDQIMRFVKGTMIKIPPISYKELAKQIDLVDRYSNHPFSSIHEKIIDLLHDLTHGGRNQILSFNNKNGITANFEPKQIAWVLRLSSIFGLLSISEMYGICSLKDRANQLLHEFNKIYGKPYTKM